MAEFGDIGDIASEISNISDGASAIPSELDIGTQVTAINERLGGEAKVERDASGEMKVNDVPVDGSVESLQKALDTLTGSQRQAVIDALGNPDLLNVSKDVREKAKTDAANAKQNETLQSLAEAKGTSLEQLQEGLTNIKKKLTDSNPSLFGKILKYTTLGTATYLSLKAIADSKTGCYANYGGQKQLIQAKPNPATAASCATFTVATTGGAITLNSNFSCEKSCQLNIPGSDEATAAQLTSKSDSTSCNCILNNNLVSPNVTITYETPTPWSVLGDIITGVGAFVEKVADEGLNLVGELGNALADIPKILMWAGIGLAIVGVLVGIGFIAKKIHDKKKLKNIKGGGVWKDGRKKNYKHWKKSMKRLQKSTPNGYLTMDQALF